MTPVLGVRSVARAVTTMVTFSASAGFAANSEAVAAIIGAFAGLVTLIFLAAGANAKRRSELDAARRQGMADQKQADDREIATLKQIHEVEMNAVTERAKQAEKNAEHYRDKYESRLERAEDDPT